MNKPKVVAVVGTNASGKSALGIRLAKQFEGEIISADSRQVFRGLDLGSGKVTTEEMQGVPHYLIDVREPGEFFSMADFQKMRGYLLEETAFMEGKKLAIEGSFISGGDCVSAEKNQSILPKGNYICMTTAIFREDKWIRALSRYFAEKDMRPRIILAVLKHKDFYNWRHSLYEVQILV